MAEEQKKDPEIDAILADLDVILSDIAEPAQGAAAPAPAPAPKVEAPKPVEPAKPAAPPPAPKIEISLSAPKPAEPPPPPPKPTEPPPAPKAAEPPPPAAAPGLSIELSPREGTLPKKAEPPKSAPAAPKPSGLPPTRPPMELGSPGPAATPSPKPPDTLPPTGAKAEPPKPAAPPPPAPKAPEPAAAPPPALAAAVASGGLGAPIPDKVPKDQIRRVAFLYTPAVQKECAAFALFLDQSATTVSKKPLYLRKVLVESVGPGHDSAGLAGRMTAAKAVSAIIVSDAASEAKVRDLQDQLSNAGFALHIVAPADIQKRSVAVDIIVDLMLLAGEA